MSDTLPSNGSICPLLTTFNCIAVDITAVNLRWYFNDESVALYTYEEDDEYPLNVTLSTPIPGVMIQIVQASVDATSVSYNSTMTANLSALIQEGVSNISCGSITSRSNEINIQGMYIYKNKDPPFYIYYHIHYLSWPHPSNTICIDIVHP